MSDENLLAHSWFCHAQFAYVKSRGRKQPVNKRGKLNTPIDKVS